MSFPYSNSEMGEAYEDWVEKTVAEPNTSEELEVEKSPTFFNRFKGFFRRNRTRHLRNVVNKGLRRTRNTKKNNATNGGVPRFTLTADKLISTNGVVNPNTGDTIKTRLSTFEQNFIKRLYGVYQGASLHGAPLNLNKYAIELMNETDENRAILLYNELIVIYILLCIDCIQVVLVSFATIFHMNRNLFNELQQNPKIFDKIKRSIKTIEDSDPIAFKKGLIKGFSSLLLTGLFLGSFWNPIALAAMGGIASAYAVLYGILGISIFLPAGAVLGTVLVNCIMPTNEWRTVGHYKPSEQFKVNLPTIFYTINSILFSSYNKVPFVTVKNKLKYWGLLQTQVDYIFRIGETWDTTSRVVSSDFIVKYLIDILNFCVYKEGNLSTEEPSNKDFTLAPNEPFSEELLKAAYPKSPLSGNPFANASAFPPTPPTLPLRSMIGGISRRRAKRKMSKQKHRRR